MELVWYTAMSMDGRIASAGDDLSFLSYVDSRGEPDDEFDSFVAGVDAVLVGGGTMRWLLRQGHSRPTSGKPTWCCRATSS